MKRCYACKEELSKSNDHYEHIIQNAIGGRLKSKGLICRACNIQFSQVIDVTLAKQLNFFSTSFNIKRDDGEPVKPFYTIDRTHYLSADGHWVSSRPLKRPVINVNVVGEKNYRYK